MQRLFADRFDEMFEILEQSFPADERRPREQQLKLFEIPEYKVFFEGEEEKIMGFMALWEFEDFVYIEHFALRADCRGRGTGSKMLGQAMSAFDKPVCLEVEPPETEKSCRRIAFYERNGMYLNHYDYIQPPLAEGQNSLPLKIMTSIGKITPGQFDSIKNTLYKYVYRVE